jgi:predicted transcriptional regulator
MGHKSLAGRPSLITTHNVRTAILQLMKDGNSLSINNIRKIVGKGSSKKYMKIRNLAMAEIAESVERLKN